MVRRFSALAFGLAALLAGWPTIARATAAYDSSGDFAPHKIANLMSRWRPRCVVSFTCPVPRELFNDVTGAIGGDSTYQVSLALDLENGRKGAPRDPVIAGMWLALAAQQGNAYAVKEVLRAQKNGRDIDVDWEKVAAALLDRVRHGDSYSVYAMSALGPMYILGRGVPRDINEGLRLLRAAADTGDTSTIETLANIYGSGMPGIPVDRNEQVRWLVKLAGHGRADVMGWVGRMLTNPPVTLFAAGPPGTPGIVPDRDVAEGYRWLMRGALMGDNGARTELGQLLMNGLSVDGQRVIAPDLVSADVWFRLTMNSPYFDNNALRASIEQRLTSAEIGEAKKRVAAFVPLSFEEAMKRTIELPPVERER